MYPREIQDRAFNQGSDARLAGEPLERCPLVATGLVMYWRWGWADVERHWGELARHPYRVLGDVKTCAAGEPAPTGA